MTQSKSDTRYVYALWCPLTEQYRYVGMTNNPETRFRCHVSGGEPGDRRSWIMALKRRGLSPTMAVVDTAQAKDIYKLEGEWIRRMIARGHKLTNGTLPGLPRSATPTEYFVMDAGRIEVLEDMAARRGSTPSELLTEALLRWNEAPEQAMKEWETLQGWWERQPPETKAMLTRLVGERPGVVRAPGKKEESE